MKIELDDDRWKGETCESCYFRDDVHCRRHPPSTGNTGFQASVIFFKRFSDADGYYHKACAEWVQSEDSLNG